MKIVSCIALGFKSVVAFINKWCEYHPKSYYFLILSLLFMLYLSISFYQTKLLQKEPIFNIQSMENREVVADTRSKRFYYPFCFQVLKIKPENYKLFKDEQSAISAGMKKVKGCSVTREVSA